MMEEFSSDFKINLKTVISHCLNSHQSVDAIVSHLTDKVGVESEHDLSLLREEDMLGVENLKPIQVRKLFLKFKEVKIQGNEKEMKIQGNEKEMKIQGNEKELKIQGNEKQMKIQGNEKLMKIQGNEKLMKIQENEKLMKIQGNKKQMKIQGNEEEMTIEGNENEIRTDNPLNEETNHVCVHWTQSMKIPWETLPTTFLEDCKNDVRPQPRDMRCVISRIFNMILAVDAHPGRRNLRYIASKMVSEYPKALGDCTDDGELISCGTFGIMKLLENRFDSFHRKRRVRLEVSRDANNELQDTCKRKKKMADSYGCMQWNPKDSPLETIETQKHKISWLQNEYEKQVRDAKTISKFMSDTYPQQRRDINSKMCIAEVLKKWPFLCETDFLFGHFHKLLGFSISILSQQMELKGERLISFFAFVGTTNPKYTTSPLKTRLDSLKSDLKSDDRLLTIIPLLMAYFNEKEDDLVCAFKDIDQKTVILEDSEHPVHPCISIFGSSGSDIRLMVSWNHVCVLETRTWQEALEGLLAVYFVFNIQYPVECALSLEFIQRCFMKLNPDRGSKSTIISNRCFGGVNRKVQKLLNQLRDFENVWPLQ